MLTVLISKNRLLWSFASSFINAGLSFQPIFESFWLFYQNVSEIKTFVDAVVEFSRSERSQDLRISCQYKNKTVPSIWYKDKVHHLIISFECLKGTIIVNFHNQIIFFIILDPFTPSYLKPIFYTLTKVDFLPFAMGHDLQFMAIYNHYF